MKQYRTITRPTDPRVHLKLPQSVYEGLKQMADYNRRRLSDEIIARLYATLAHQEQIRTDTQLVELMQLIYNENLLYRK